MGAPYESLPMKALEDLARAKSDINGVAFTDEVFATVIGVSSRAITRWRSAGGQIPWPSADTAACRMGLHPLLVWGNAWTALDNDFLRAHHAPADERTPTQRRVIKAVDAAMNKIGDAMAATMAADVEPELIAS